MTPRLPAMTSKEVVKVVLKLGFTLDRQSGSHAVYYRNSDRKRVIVSLHSRKAVKPKTLIGIIKDMGLNVDEFRDML